jgi:hypothetical protein
MQPYSGVTTTSKGASSLHRISSLRGRHKATRPNRLMILMTRSHFEEPPMTIATDLTEEQVQQVFFCADKGYTKADAAKEMGICPAWMVRSAKRLGIYPALNAEFERHAAVRKRGFTLDASMVAELKEIAATGPTNIPECTFTTPEEDEAWREVEKKINPVWQSPSPHDFGGVCVFHGCRYSAYEQCYMCVLAGEAAKDEAWAEAEKRMDAIGQNGGTGEHYKAPASKYHVQIKGQWVDVYDILTAYSVTNPADAHAIKKMLCPGKRGAKDGIQDRREAIASLERAIELEQGR